MARTPEADRVKSWGERVGAATRDVYGVWAEKYSVNMLEDYYYGHQWANQSEEWDTRKYVINLFYPSIQISMPSSMFAEPSFRVKAKKTRTDDAQSDAATRAKLQEDALNTVVSDPDFEFALEAGLGLLDAQFRFGAVEVGYSADFTENPNAGRPVLNDDGSAMMEGEAPVVQPQQVVTSESLFMKWIPAKQFRISVVNTNSLAKCDWVGYYEWLHIEDVKSNRGFKNTSTVTASGRVMVRGENPNDMVERKPGMVKVWRVWDLRAKVKRTFAEGHDKFFQEKPFKFLPLAVLKFNEILGQFLPLPPCYNWVHPQNELNDTRQMQRIHRKRFIRRYLRKSGAFVNDEEFLKLLSGEDGVSAEVTGDPNAAVVPLADAPLDSQVVRNIPQTQDDFTRISGISGEAQQVAQSETATQANLIAVAGKVREAYRRVQVGKWCGAIGRLILMTMRENMALPFWIKQAVDPESPGSAQEAQEVTYLWQQIKAEDLGDIDLEIECEIESMSPAQQAEDRDNWLAFLNLIQTPGVGTLLLSSPYLMRKTANYFGISAQRDISEIASAVQAVVAMQAMNASGGAGTPSKGKGGEAAPGAVPTQEATAAQIAQQLPVELAQQNG